MLLERNQIGKREDLANYISRVDAKSKPALAMIPKGPAISNMLFEWQLDDFESPEDLSVEDGVDVESYDNASPNRARTSMYAMKVRDSAMVSDLAEEVSNVAGLSKGELAESIMKKLEKLSRTIECFLCGDQAAVAGAAGIAYKTRGIGAWINNTAATVPSAFPAAFVTPAASIYSTASLATLTEAAVNTVLTSIYSETGVAKSYDLLAGTSLKTQFSNYTRTAAGGTGGGGSATSDSMQVVRFINLPPATFGSVVDTFLGDFGTLRIHPTLWNAYYTASGAAFGNNTNATIQNNRGYILDMSLLELNYKRLPRVKQLEDRGGGPRFLVDAILGWKVKNPKGLGAFKCTTA